MSPGATDLEITLKGVAPQAPRGIATRYRRAWQTELMTTTCDLVAAIKDELKAAHVTYADVADALGLSQSSVKRMFARADMPLSRIDAILRLVRLDVADLARRVADAAPLRHELTLSQEEAVVADRRLMLLAVCCLSQWTLEQMVATYAIDTIEAQALLARLDALGIVAFKPPGHYRLNVAKTFRWQPHGPVMTYFRTQVAGDYFDAGFDGDGETLMLVHGHVGAAAATGFVERLQRIGEDFAQQHRAEQRLPDDRKAPYPLVAAMRSWVFAAFRDLQRDGGGSTGA